MTAGLLLLAVVGVEATLLHGSPAGVSWAALGVALLIAAGMLAPAQWQPHRRWLGAALAITAAGLLLADAATAGWLAAAAAAVGLIRPHRARPDLWQLTAGAMQLLLALLAGALWWSDAGPHAAPFGPSTILAHALLGGHWLLRDLRSDAQRIPERSAATMLAVGAAVMIGWWVGDALLVQAGTYRVPMQFNTALCTFSAGLSLAWLANGRHRAALLALLPLLPLTVATLLDEYLRLGLGVGEWLLIHPVVAEGVAGGQMAPNTAIAFLLGALSIAAAPAGAASTPARWAATWAGGFTVTAIAAIALAGYLFDAPELRAWDLRTPMALWTSVALALFGLGLGFCGAELQPARRRRAAWVPLLVAIGTVVASVLAWDALGTQRNRALEAAAHQQAEHIRNAIDRGYRSRGRAMQRMAERLAASIDEPDIADRFGAESVAYLRDFPSMIALSRLDADRIVRQVHAPTVDLRPLLGRPLDFDAPRRDTFARAVDGGALAVSPRLALLSGRPGQLMIVPVMSAGRPAGFVVAAIEHDRLFPELLADVAPLTSARLAHGDSRLFERGDIDRPAYRQRFAAGGLDLELSLGLPPGTNDGRRLATAMLLTGLVSGGLLALALRLAALARQRAESAEAATQALQRQVAETERAESALSASQREVANVLEAISDAVMMVDSDWRFVYLNRQAEQLLRRSRDDLLGRSLWDDYADAEDTFGVAYRRAVREQVSTSVEAYYPPLQSWFEARAYPHPTGLAIYFRDVTERKRQALALERSELLLRAAGKTARLGGWAVDVASGQVHWTDEVCAIHEVPAGTSPTLEQALDFYAAESRERLAGVYQRCLLTGEPWDAEFELLTASGRSLWVRSIGEAQRDASGEIVRVHGAFQDISAQKQAELALRHGAEQQRAALENLRQVMDSAIEVICAIDETTGFIALNAASERIWGYPPEQLIGRPMELIVHPDDLESTRQATAAVVAGEPNFDFRNRNITRDGRVIRMQWSASWSAQNRRLYCIGRDRTEQHRSEMLDAGKRAILTGIAGNVAMASSLEALVRLIEEQFPGLHGVVLLADGRQGRLRVAAAPTLPIACRAPIDDRDVAIGIGGEAAECGSEVLAIDLGVGDAAPEWATRLRANGLFAGWALPIRGSTGQVLGAFELYCDGARAPSAAERQAFADVVAIAAIAIEQATTTAAILRNSARLSRLAEAGVVINRNIGKQSLYQLLVDQLRDLVGARMAVLTLADGRDWRHAMVTVSLAERHARWRNFRAEPDGAGIYRLVCERNQPLRLSQAELEAHPAFRHYSGHGDAHPALRGLLAVPLVGSDGANLGVLQLSDNADGEFDDDDQAIAVQFAQMAATALERSRLIERLHERDRFFDLSLELFCVYDPADGHFLQVNPAFVMLLGYTEAELLGRPSIEFVHPDDRDIALLNGEKMRSTGDELLGFVVRYIAADGSTCWLEWAGSADRNGLYYLVARNITERRRIERERDFAETHDVATGLPRYSMLETALGDLLDRGLAPTVFFIDLDHMHGINESMGHGIGDAALQVTAARLDQVFGRCERLARFAGDEFVGVVPGLDAIAAAALAEQARRAVAEPIEGDGYRVFVTASVGIARAPLHGDSSVELLRRAEAAMTQAKRQGRDTACEFSAEHMQQLEDRRVLGSRLREAIANGELSLVFQPRLDAGSLRLNGFEALARWHSAELGAVPPDRFVPIAEALGLMPELGNWVLQQACRQIRSWLDHGHADFTVSVNVSAHQLQRQDLLQQVRGALAAESIPPHMLEIELTESSLMENVERVQSTLAELKSLGVSLSLDDFGTGYSSLAYLKQFSLDKLKIDRHFVTDLPDDPHDVAIARTIVAMAHQLKMTVAAEGVETEAQAAFLREIGCDELQGYLFGRPLPADAALPLFAAAESADH